MPSSPIANSEKRHAKKGCLGVTECMEAWKNSCKFMWRLRIKDWVSMVLGLKGSGRTLPNETTTSVIRSQPIEHAKWDSGRGSLNDMASGHTSKQKNSWKGVKGWREHSHEGFEEFGSEMRSLWLSYHIGPCNWSYRIGRFAGLAALRHQLLSRLLTPSHKIVVRLVPDIAEDIQANTLAIDAL